MAKQQNTEQNQEEGKPGRQKKSRASSTNKPAVAPTEGSLETKGKDGRYRRTLRSGAVAVI